MVLSNIEGQWRYIGTLAYSPVTRTFCALDKHGYVVAWDVHASSARYMVVCPD